MAETALVVSSRPIDVYLPEYKLEEAKARSDQFRQFVSDRLVPSIDYSAPGDGRPPALKKAGAEKLCSFFGFTPKFELTEKIEDWTGERYGQPLFAYTYQCEVWKGERYIVSCHGHCNSWESRYRWRWMSPAQLPPGYDTTSLWRRESTQEEFDFAIKKKETSGPYGKPAEYWEQFETAIASRVAVATMKQTASGRELAAWRIPSLQFRVPNPDPYDAVNPCMKIAHKRAFVAGILISTNASDFFTQDLDDDIPDAPQPAPPPAPEPRTAAAPRTAAPPQDAAPRVEPELEAIWQRMARGTRDQRLEEFRKLKNALVELHGDEQGASMYYGVLARYHIAHASELTSLTVARQAIADLFHAAQAGADLS